MRLKYLGLAFLALALTACGSDKPKTETQQPVVQKTVVSSVTPGSVQDFQKNVGDTVYFDTNSSVIRSDGQSVLSGQTAWLSKYNNVAIRIEGNTDERGTREYNLALGARRANSVKRYLIAQGVAVNRITVISYGKERPAVEGNNSEAWSQNRRAVTVLVSGFNN